MDDSKLTKEQRQALEEALARAGAFEETVRTKGWEYIKSFYANNLQMFASDLILSEDKPIQEFEAKRRELIGVRKLMTLIDSDLQTLEIYRKKQNEQKTG